MVTYLRYFQPRSELRSSRSPRFLRLRRTGSYPLLCPVRALRIYFERSAPFRRTEQLFVGFGNRAKGHPVTKQRLSKWIVDAVMLAYSSLGLQCPIGVRAHSTRGIASSWAWSSGVSITEICTGGWLGHSVHIC